MNIKVKAALEVAGFFAGVLVVSGLTKLGLDYLESVYGAKAIANGAIFCLLAGAIYFIGGILYDIRVAQLRYKEKLEEMTKK